MEPLRAIVGNARVVALGEGSHGTHEIFAWKTRMVEFLVTQMGFTVFAREMVMPEAFDINDYVMTGRGDPGKALAATYNWPGNSEEVLDMIRWMRSHNADPKHSQKVKFYGFDLGYEGRALRTSLDYLREVDAEQARAFSKSLALLADPFLAEHFSSLPKSQTESLLPVAQRLLARLDEQREAYARRTSPERWSLARQHAQILVQWVLAGQGRGDRMSRDHFMADNAAWILEREGPNAKVILSAHNGHVGCALVRPGEGQGGMGCHLRRMLGRDLVVFGSMLGHGHVHAVKIGDPPHSAIRTFEMPPLSDMSFSGAFVRSGLSAAVVDFRAIPKAGAVAEWFALPHQAWMLGAPFLGPENIRNRIFSAEFDALFFVDSTTSSHFRPSVRQRDEEVLPAPANLGFEVRDALGRPQHWSVPSISSEFDYVVSASAHHPYEGNLSALIARPEGHHYGEGSGVIRQMIDATPYRGKWVRLRAMIRADVKSEGSRAHFWLLPANPTLNERAVTTNAWQPYELVVHIPESEKYIEYGLTLVGDGRVWIDDVSLEIATSEKPVRSPH
jgi:erythromycin esterase